MTFFKKHDEQLPDAGQLLINVEIVRLANEINNRLVAIAEMEQRSEELLHLHNQLLQARQREREINEQIAQLDQRNMASCCTIS